MSKDIVSMKINGGIFTVMSLKRLGRKNAISVARRSLNKPAKLLVKAAQSNAPVRTEAYGIEDGVLRLSIESRTRSKKGIPFVVVGPSNNPAWENMNLGRSITKVAHRVEYGFPKYRVVGWTGGHWNRRPILELEGNLPAIPFMRQTADQSGKEAMRLGIEEMKKLIKKEAAKIKSGQKVKK